MAALNIIAAHKLSSLSSQLTNSSFITQSHKPNSLPFFWCTQTFRKPGPSKQWVLSTRKNRNFTVGSVMEDREVVSVEDNHATDQESRLLLNGSEELETLQSSSSSSEGKGDEDELDKLTGRAINALIVLGFGTFAVSKLLTIDHDYWHVRYLIFDSVLGLFTVFSFIIVIWIFEFWGSYTDELFKWVSLICSMWKWASALYFLFVLWALKWACLKALSFLLELVGPWYLLMLWNYT